jgi:hypothetical protein
MCVGVLCACVRVFPSPGEARPSGVAAGAGSGGGLGVVGSGGGGARARRILPQIDQSLVFGRSPDLADALGGRRRSSSCPAVPGLCRPLSADQAGAALRPERPPRVLRSGGFGSSSGAWGLTIFGRLDCW